MSKDRFLARWSRRKRDAASGSEAPPGAPPEAPSAAQPTAQSDAPTDVDPAAGADAAGPDQAETAAHIAALPDVETLTAQSDITGFLRRGVPPLLRQAALRRMWRVNPAIRDYVDPAREYAFDWNVPGGAPGGGMVSQQEAAALLTRVFAPKEKADDAQAAGPQATSDEPNCAPDAPHEPVSAAIGPEPMPRATQDLAEPGRDAAPRRRHGGATPAWLPGNDA